MACMRIKACMKMVACMRICMACIRIRMMRLMSASAYAYAYRRLYIYEPYALKRSQSTSHSSIESNTLGGNSQTGDDQ